MSDYINPLLQWLNANPEWAGLVTFIISAAESVAIIGTIVPGSITMTAIGALAGAGIIPLGPTLIWAILGAVVGDGISYWMGHYFKDRLRNIWPFSRNPTILEKGEVFVHHYGVMSVFIGRFLGPVRAMVPLVAGMLGMKPLQFTIANITSAIGWAPIYMLPGILLGAASLELPPNIAIHAILALILISLFIILCLWFTYKLLQLISYQTEQLLNWLWKNLQKSRYFHITTIILKHHDDKQHHAQLALVFYFLLASLLLLCLIGYVMVKGPQHIFMNDAFFHFFRGIRSPMLDTFMINITLLGQKEIIFPMLLVVFAWLIYKKRTRLAIHALTLGVLAGASVTFIKHFVHSGRPWGIFNSPESFSMPSGHTTLVATVFMGIAFMLAKPIPQKYRWLIYFPAILVTFAVGISRLYLGAHWFTDVLAGWLLSAILLLLVIISFHRHDEKNIQLRSISLVCLFTLIICYSFYHHYHFSQLKRDYALINWPGLDISATEWWHKDQLIPAWHVSLFGVSTERINIQWAGDLEKIKNTLLKEGWSKPPARDWISTLHRVTGIQSTAYLPLVSPEYLDKKPALILAKRSASNKALLVIRLWQSSRTLLPTRTPLWVGTIGIVPRSYNWPFRKRHIFKIDPADIFPTKMDGKNWQWKLMTVKLPIKSKSSTQQTILFIKAKH